jgi:CheY-like chemotaxis protein
MRKESRARPRILLVDDDPDLLEMYRDLLGQLPSGPEIHTATSGARAMALLEAEAFRLMVCDLKMPRMDGLQVLSIVRRTHPQLRTVALTSVLDEEFRSRAYALGVDLFWQKPASEEEIRMFLECLESLLGPETEGGFRGIQSKSLVDIIQLECLSQGSLVLRITNGKLTGKIWIQEGQLIDAETDGQNGEGAFHQILSWQAGHFETLPAEPSRPRAIAKPYNGLLLESAQALDESRTRLGGEGAGAAPASAPAGLSEIEGIEFVLAVQRGETSPRVARGLEDPKAMAAWARLSLASFRSLGEHLRAGPLEQIEALGPRRHVALASQGDLEFCVGWKPSLGAGQVRTLMKKVLALWAC